jgi:hypothetical protein
MALIHTIQVVSEKRSGSTVSSTRKSETRRYLACIVTTTTVRTLELDAAKKADIETELSELRKPMLADLRAKFGNITVEAAQAWHKAASERWYNQVDGRFPTMDKFRDAYKAKHDLSSFHPFQNFEVEAEADMIARGFEHPFKGQYEIVEAASRIESCERQLAHWYKLVLGSQAVVSWHGNVGLAQKAMGSLDYLRTRGDEVTIRTDITITETKKRTKVAS